MPTHAHHPDQHIVTLWLPRELLAAIERERRLRRMARSEWLRYAAARALGYPERQALLASRAARETGGPKHLGRPDPRARAGRQGPTSSRRPAPRPRARPPARRRPTAAARSLARLARGLSPL